MYSRFTIPINRSLENLKESIHLNPVLMDEGLFNRFRLRVTGMSQDNKFWLINPGLTIPLHPFARARIETTSKDACEIKGVLIFGPVFIGFFSFAYGFMIKETIKNFINNVGTDKFGIAMFLTLFAFAWFVFIPLFVIRRWKREVVKKISANLNQ